jgi:hypothetical protein
LLRLTMPTSSMRSIGGRRWNVSRRGAREADRHHSRPRRARPPRALHP